VRARADEDHVGAPKQPGPFFARVLRMCRRSSAAAAHDFASIALEAAADLIQDLIQDVVAADKNDRPSGDLRLPAVFAVGGVGAISEALGATRWEHNAVWGWRHQFSPN
jgi:hypothetical protein